MPYRKPRAKRGQLSPEALAYLTDDQTRMMVIRYGVIVMGSRSDGDPTPDELWRQYRDDFLPEFIRESWTATFTLVALGCTPSRPGTGRILNPYRYPAAESA